MIKRISHVGVVVSNLDQALKLYERVFGLRPSVVKDAADAKFRVAFMPVGDGEIELIEPIDPDTSFSRFLQTRGQGIHHISLSTDDIEFEADRMRREGAVFAGEKPRMGAHGVRIIFTKPETTGGVTYELCEES